MKPPALPKRFLSKPCVTVPQDLIALGPKLSHVRVAEPSTLNPRPCGILRVQRCKLNSQEMSVGLSQTRRSRSSPALELHTADTVSGLCSPVLHLRDIHAYMENNDGAIASRSTPLAAGSHRQACQGHLRTNEKGSDTTL